jgi:hypothetical protein
MTPISSPDKCHGPGNEKEIHVMPSTYIQERVNPRIDWYDKRAVSCKRTHMFLQYFVAVASIVMVVILNEPDFPRLVLALLAGLIAIASTIERIGQFGDRWHMYRATYEALQSETNLYSNKAGPYASGEGDRLIVERVEAVLSSEGTRWGSLVTKVAASAREHRLPLP